MKHHPGLLIPHTDDCELCGKSKELRLATLIADAIQLLFAAIAIVVVAYALVAWFFGGIYS